MMSMRAYARHRGYASDNAIRKLVKSGLLPTVNGKIDPAVCDPIMDDRAAAEGQAPMPVAPAARKGADSPPRSRAAQGATSETLAEARLRKERALADCREMEAAKLRGELVAADDAVADYLQFVQACRARLLAVPTKMSPILAAQDDPREVEQALGAEIHEALEELSKHESSGVGEPCAA